MNASRIAAWTVLGLWAACWAFFAFAAGLRWDGPVGLVALLVVGIPLSACCWPRLGAALLVVESLFLLGAVLFYLHNSLWTTLLLIGTLALPPGLTGLLLLAGGAGISQGKNELEHPAVNGESGRTDHATIS